MGHKHPPETGKQLKLLAELIEAFEGTTGLSGMDALTVSELKAIMALMQTSTQQEAAAKCGVRTDTYKKTLASVRQKLLLENTAQLKAALQGPL